MEKNWNLNEPDFMNLSESDKDLLEKLEKAETWNDATAEVLKSINNETESDINARWEEYEKSWEEIKKEQDERKELLEKTGLKEVFEKKLAYLYEQYGAIPKKKWITLSAWERSPEVLNKRKMNLRQKSQKLWLSFFHVKSGMQLNGDPWKELEKLEPYSREEILSHLLEEQVTEEVLALHKVPLNAFGKLSKDPQKFLEQEIQKKLQEEKEKQKEISGFYSISYNKANKPAAEKSDKKDVAA